MRILEIGPDGVVLDANHPLASQAVTFQVKVLSVKEDAE
jgi:FKBP-type peptidyl-prolyl cis-trans isomerase 2